MKSASVVFVTPDNLVGLGLRGRSLESPLTWAAIGGHIEPHETFAVRKSRDQGVPNVDFKILTNFSGQWIVRIPTEDF